MFERARAASPGPIHLDLRSHDLRVVTLGEAAIATFHLHDPGVLCRCTVVLRATAGGWRIVHLYASNFTAPGASQRP